MAEATRFFAPINFKTRFPALDGLRALAVTGVFAAHYGGGGHGNLLLRAVNRVHFAGGLGVNLFFVLSGFLITGILYDTRADSRYFLRFFARRSLRIFPLFYLTAAVLLVLTAVFHYEWKPLQATFLLYLGNLFANYDFSLYTVPSANHPTAVLNLSHLWSLCVEEQFYLLWPVLVWLVRDRRNLLWTAGGIALLSLLARGAMCLWAPGEAERWIYRTLPFQMDTLLFGAILALLLRGPASNVVQRNCKYVFVVAGVLFLVCYFGFGYASPQFLTVGLSLVALSSAGLIGSSLRTGSAAFRLFHLAPLRFIGRYSYGFYLLHYLYGWAWIQFLIFCSTHLHSLALGGLVALPLNYGLTLLVAWLSFRLFESRFLRYKTHFEYDSEQRTHTHAFRPPDQEGAGLLK